MKNSFKTILVLWGALTASSASALDYGEIVKTRIADLVNINSTTATAGGPKACVDRYQKLYKDGVLNIAVGFGYWDNSPDEYVFDQFIANGFRNNLVAPCSPGMNVCGFTRTGDVFRKMVRGPDGKMNRLTISITYGTLSTDNLKNTTINRVQQYAKCEAATEKYFSEVSRGSEVVMYIGHARDGGGPDFCPPVRKSDKHTDYDWYRKAAPGFKKLLSAMETSRSNGRENQMVGLYSCYSRRHFHNKMAAKIPDAGYVLTDVEITSQDAIASVATTIDAIIGHKCVKSFAEGLRLSPGVKMHGMFTKSSP
ncbi:MAG: hypothetical protein V4598_05080 [Bdellovibrionota bacterium]